MDAIETIIENKLCQTEVEFIACFLFFVYPRSCIDALIYVSITHGKVEVNVWTVTKRTNYKGEERDTEG